MVYKLGKLIGKGSDGVVYELLGDQGNGNVIKFIQGDAFGIKNYIEYYIFTNLDEKYITKCKNLEIDDDGLIKIIFDKADMDLKDYIQKNKLSDKRKKEIMIQLLSGLEYLQSFNIIHGDIKPANILVFGENIKYTDFNLSFIHTIDSKINKKLYTMTYRPPEISEEKASLKSDIWALGCTFFEIYYGYEYFNYSKEKKFFHIKNSFENKEENSVFNDLIKNMIHTNENRRFSVENIKNHRYFLKDTFPGRFIKKKLMNNIKFSNNLMSNFALYDIKAKIDQKIFLSKTENFSCIPIHKNYKKIEDKICQGNFNLNLFS